MTRPSVSDSAVFVGEVEFYQDKLIGKKWRPLIAHGYEESPLGRARLELFPNAEKVRTMSPSRTILLVDCVALRSTHIENRAVAVIRLKDETSIQLYSQNHEELMAALSRIAFPKKYVTIPSTSLETPTSDEEFEIYNEYPVLLLPSTLTKSKKIPEGSYIMEFGNDLVLKNGEEELLTFKYCDFLWIACGENCLGFEIAREGVLEFICASPLVIIESFRGHIKFSSVFTPPSVKTTNKYNRCYHPKGISANNTPESSKNTTMESKRSGLSSESFASTDHSISPLHVSFSDESQSEEKKTSKLFKFFRRNSKKQKDQEGRTTFEQNADNEWLRIPPEITQPAVVPQLTEDQFKLELQKTLEETKIRHLVDRCSETDI